MSVGSMWLAFKKQLGHPGKFKNKEPRISNDILCWHPIHGDHTHTTDCQNSSFISRRTDSDLFIQHYSLLYTDKKIEI